MVSGIAYQNKDIEFKILSEAFRERSFQAYGLDLPRIREVLPTNLPAVSANELRMDSLFLLEDGTYALVDYESENREENRIKYVNYIARIAERFYREHGRVPVIRMIVIYTGDVEKAEHIFEMGCMTLTMEQVFVANFPTEKIYKSVEQKLEHDERLTEQEMMQMLLLPLSEKGKEKQKRVKQIIGLAKRVKDEAEQKFILSGLLVSSDKFICREDAEAIRREICMTKVGRLLFEEGIEQGMERGIEALILDNLEEHVPEEQVIRKLQRHFHLDETAARAYFERFALEKQ